MTVPCSCRATIADSLKSVTQQLHEAEARSKHLLDLEADLDSRDELFNQKVLLYLTLSSCLQSLLVPAADTNAACMLILGSLQLQMLPQTCNSPSQIEGICTFAQSCSWSRSVVTAVDLLSLSVVACTLSLLALATLFPTLGFQSVINTISTAFPLVT